jgi:NAD(P)H-flavin reductase
MTQSVLPVFGSPDTRVIACADPMVPAPYRVTRVKRETHDTFTLELESAVGPTVFSFQPGQFNMLYVHGVGEVPISISGDPAKTNVIVHTTRAVGTVTRAMRALRKDDVLGVRGPFGTPWPVQAAEGRDLVIVTGGIGLAPLRPCIYQVLGALNRFRRLSLLYGARTPKDILFAAELKKWGGRSNSQVQVTVDRATEGWRGNVGVVTTLIPNAPFDPADTIALICGPEIMMRFTVMALQSRGVPCENIHVSIERNMKCAIGMCGHCQFGPEFICKDGPVFPYERIKRLFTIREL